MSFIGCATSEEDGPNFEPPILSRPYQRGQIRLREAQAFSTVQREAGAFHERMARKHGLDNPVGLAHFKASRSYKEAAGKLQEMFDQNQTQIPPKAIHQAHKAAVGFHKKQAQKAGLDTPVGQAHVAALQHHMGIAKQAKQQAKQAKASSAGAAGKKSPVPVPKKSEQPSEDVRQNLPPQPLQKLQQKKEAKIRNFGRRGREGDGKGPYEGKPTFPRSDRAIAKPDTVFRGKKPAPGKYGPKAAAPRIHGGHDVKGGTLDRESRRSLRRRPIWESDDSERDRSESGLTA